MNAVTLYAIADQYLEAFERLHDLDLPQEVIADTMDGLTVHFDEKAKAVASVALTMEADADVIQAAIEKLTIRRDRINARRQWLMDYLLIHMQRTGITKIESPILTIAVRKNPERVEIADFEAVPPQYWTQKPPPPPAISKTLIKSAIKSGAQVPGAYLTQDERIEIKV